MRRNSKEWCQYEQSNVTSEIKGIKGHLTQNKIKVHKYNQTTAIQYCTDDAWLLPLEAYRERQVATRNVIKVKLIPWVLEIGRHV